MNAKSNVGSVRYNEADNDFSSFKSNFFGVFGLKSCFRIVFIEYKKFYKLCFLKKHNFRFLKIYLGSKLEMIFYRA